MKTNIGILVTYVTQFVNNIRYVCFSKELEMKCTVILISGLLFSMNLFAQGELKNENKRSGEERYVHDWTLELFGGGTFKRNAILYTLGIDYEHRLHVLDDHLAVGFLGDYEFAEQEEELLLTPMLFYFVGNHWKLMTGIGGSYLNEKVHSNQSKSLNKTIFLTLFRAGIAKEFDINDQIILSPTLQLDATKNYVAIVLGLGFGFGK